MKWLWKLLLNRKIAFSIALPSFYRNREMEIKEEGDVEKVPEVTVSRDFKHADAILVKRFLAMAKEFEAQYPGQKLVVTCTYRSPEYQRKLFNQGRNGNPGPVVTNADGYNKKSRHNSFPSKALDFCVVNCGKTTWDEKFYWPVLPLAKKHGLFSGGEWTKFPDWPHVEIRENT